MISLHTRAKFTKKCVPHHRVVSYETMGRKLLWKQKELINIVPHTIAYVI
jgi:uncharacterized protein (UPF0248 family)